MVTGQLFSFKESSKKPRDLPRLVMPMVFMRRCWYVNVLVFPTISGRVLFRMNGLRGRGCLEEAWIQCHSSRRDVLLNPSQSSRTAETKAMSGGLFENTGGTCLSSIGQALHHTMMMLLPWSCVSLLDSWGTCGLVFCFLTNFFGQSIDAGLLEPSQFVWRRLISKASSETKMWWWQVHSRCSLEHWCLALRHWQRHVGRWVVAWERSPSIVSNSTIHFFKIIQRLWKETCQK